MLVLLLTASNTHSQSYLFNSKYSNLSEEGPGVYFGYTNQHFKFSSGTNNLITNGIWGNNKSLHGFEFGLLAQGTINNGIGAYFAVNMEFYTSGNSPSSTYGSASLDEAYTDYSEFTFEIPLHIQFKQPIDDDIIAIGAHTGPTLTFTYLSLFEDTRGYYGSFDGFNSSNMKVFNPTWDLALFLEIGKVRFDVQWSYGLRDYKIEGLDRATRSKFSAGLTIFISFNAIEDFFDYLY